VIGLQLVPVVLSLIVLGAHFLRAGNLVLLTFVLLLVPLLGVRRRWVSRLVQVVLVLGAAEWVRTLIQTAARRSAAGEPMLRLIVILGSVALVTALSALALRTGPLGRWYEA
jgi:hypothetical protein